MMKSMLGGAAVVFVALAAWSVGEEPGKGGATGSQELVGRYELVSGEKDGQPISREELQGATVRIGANAITTFDKENKQVYAATYQLDTSSRPWRIDMTATITPGAKGEGARTSGVVEKQGETVKLAYALPGGKAPTELKGGEKQHLMVLRKVAD